MGPKSPQGAPRGPREPEDPAPSPGIAQKIVPFRRARLEVIGVGKGGCLRKVEGLRRAEGGWEGAEFEVGETWTGRTGSVSPS